MDDLRIGAPAHPRPLAAPRNDAMTDSSILILVDGTCIFCNRLVSFFLRHDHNGILRFAHLQGALARTLLERHGLTLDIDAIYAITDYGAQHERVHIDGAAGRLIWPRLFRAAAFMRFVPLFLLNLQYRLFARVRYRLFGQADACIVPSTEQRSRFLD
jgi:predicted DCC family thiol-disulfide oxidoreductase YuxK